MVRTWKAEGVAGMLVFAALVILPLAISMHRPTQGPAEIILVGRTVEHGGWSPPRIVVKQGQRVRLVVWSHDVTHGFAIPGLVDAGMIPGGTSRTVEFVAKQAGRYPFQCTVICSPEHAYLQGELIVEP